MCVWVHPYTHANVQDRLSSLWGTPAAVLRTITDGVVNGVSSIYPQGSDGAVAIASVWMKPWMDFSVRTGGPQKIWTSQWNVRLKTSTAKKKQTKQLKTYWVSNNTAFLLYKPVGKPGFKHICL